MIVIVGKCPNCKERVENRDEGITNAYFIHSICYRCDLPYWVHVNGPECIAYTEAEFELMSPTHRHCYRRSG